MEEMYATDTYFVVLGDGLEDSGKEYHVINKVTEVVEYRTSFLPMAIGIMLDLTSDLEDKTEVYENLREGSDPEDDTPSPLHLVN
jgi:hypothetical protein